MLKKTGASPCKSPLKKKLLSCGLEGCCSGSVQSREFCWQVWRGGRAARGEQGSPGERHHVLLLGSHRPAGTLRAGDARKQFGRCSGGLVDKGGIQIKKKTTMFPPLQLIQAGKGEALRIRAILRSLVPLEDLVGVISLPVQIPAFGKGKHTDKQGEFIKSGRLY